MPRLTPPAPTSMKITLEGKTCVILGVANKRSIAWACARSLSREGMRIAFTYIGERMEKTVRGLAEECPGSIVLPCDVTKPEEIDAAFDKIGERLAGDRATDAVGGARRPLERFRRR